MRVAIQRAVTGAGRQPTTQETERRVYQVTATLPIGDVIWFQGEVCVCTKS